MASRELTGRPEDYGDGVAAIGLVIARLLTDHEQAGGDLRDVRINIVRSATNGTLITLDRYTT